MTVSSIKHVPIIWRFHGNDSFFFAHYGLKLITIWLKYIIISTGFNSCINAIMQGRNRQVYLYSRIYQYTCHVFGSHLKNGGHIGAQIMTCDIILTFSE